eukprot:TRINITY_DN3648_c0_g1_i1.p1 TRINITY_DN3648_c0_g1~~TRINITY_DN3648_c0_g1_i1.p1  ORF type:complete len:149 (+),score=53.76 TRINITY_DN3648_c0_g1_i1:123-569(+)
MQQGRPAKPLTDSEWMERYNQLLMEHTAAMKKWKEPLAERDAKILELEELLKQLREELGITKNELSAEELLVNQGLERERDLEARLKELMDRLAQLDKQHEAEIEAMTSKFNMELADEKAREALLEQQQPVVADELKEKKVPTAWPLV